MSSCDELERQEILKNEESGELVAYISDADTICALCYAEFLDPEDLKIHTDQVHRTRKCAVTKCQLCPEEFHDVMEYAEHTRDIHISTLKCCTYCWRVFEEYNDFIKHYKKHVKTKSGAYSCSQCPQGYSDLLLLKKHEYEYHSSIISDGIMLHPYLPYLSAALKVKSITFIEALGSDVVYICVGCSFSTVDITTYLRHVKSNICKVYVCGECGNVFNTKNNIMKHFQLPCNIFGIKEKKSQLCTDCNSNISVKHFGKHKTHCKPIKCYICDITFQNMNDWSEHQSVEHTGMTVAVETCKFCWKRCVGKIAMEKHIEKTHKPELHMYKYLCMYCKSVFKHPQKLFAHYITLHKDLNPYTCKICDKTFHLRKKFTIHIKLIHSSIGFVEFDENYHVFFTDKKSKNPFIPRSVYVDGTRNDASISDSDKDVLDTDFINATENEGNQTEVEVKKAKVKRRRYTKSRKEKETVSIESSDDSEPLLAVRERVCLQKRMANKSVMRAKSNKNPLTCKTCNKYCYTYQNYKHHVSLHSKHEVKKCIKCSKIFKSKTKLNEHIEKEHSSSKLTETLKSLLEKRKTGGSLTDDLPASEKFRRTIKKATTDVTTTSATITPVNEKISVQKFIENFVPEDNKTGTAINTSATIQLITGPKREPAIKMTKFKPNPVSDSLKLSMPVKFTDHYTEKVRISVKLLQTPTKVNNYHSDNSNDDTDMDRHESIPDVAEEVLLENCCEEEQTPKDSDVKHKIILPQLPVEMKDIKIAHLLPEAPFYKIVKVKDVLEQQESEKADEAKTGLNSIKLPDGTKLVTTNPLAHLLGGDSDKIMKSYKSTYYKTKNKNFRSMLTKALAMLDKPTPKKKRNDSADETNKE